MSIHFWQRMEKKHEYGIDIIKSNDYDDKDRTAVAMKARNSYPQRRRNKGEG